MATESLTIAEAKSQLGDVITATEKAINRLKSVQQELASDTVTLKFINNEMAKGTELDDDSPFGTWTEWKEHIEGQIKNGENAIKRIEVQKAELVAFNYFMSEAPTS